MKQHNENLRAVAGELDFSNYIQEYLDEIFNRCDIVVYGNEGSIPHFHIQSKDRKYECCICMYEPLYFNHGNKTDKLNKKQREALDKWLQDPNNVYLVSNWEALNGLWYNLGNPLINFNKNGKKPDYTNIENMRS